MNDRHKVIDPTSTLGNRPIRVITAHAFHGGVSPGYLESLGQARIRDRAQTGDIRLIKHRPCPTIVNMQWPHGWLG